MPAAGLSDHSCGGGAEVRPNPQVSSHSAGRGKETQASQGHGLLRLGPLRGRGSVTRENPRECQYFSRFPAASRRFQLRSCPSVPATAGSPPRAQRGQLVRRPGLLGPRAGPTPRLPGQAARRLPAGAHRNAPPRGPCPAAAPRPDRDSWVPKGLSRQRSGPSPPHATHPPRACPSAHAPARYLRSRSRSSSTWPLSPGGRPSARPLGSAPRTPLATWTLHREEGRWGDYHILAYQCASRGLSSQWSLWKGGDWAEHA